MARKRSYLVTQSAKAQLREAKQWSRARWGDELTRAYFQELGEAAQRLGEEYRTYRTRHELTGGTGLSLYPFREHYLVYEPISERKIVIVAILRQRQDVAGTLNRGKHLIAFELQQIRRELERRRRRS